MTIPCMNMLKFCHNTGLPVRLFGRRIMTVIQVLFASPFVQSSL